MFNSPFKNDNPTQPKVTITEDGMTAYLFVPPPRNPSEKYTPAQLVDVLRSAGITTGIKSSVLMEIISKNSYNKPLLIAQGQPPKNGTDGYFTFHFRTQVDNKPKVLPDGSVDYRSVDMYEAVQYGDIVATYTPASKGTLGFTVRGEHLNAVSGNELPPLSGTGFSISSDNTTYTSLMNGKIEYANHTITITNLLEIKDDVDLTSGDIVFDGDVLIHGNVLVGSKIHAGGSLTILGNVEGAFIYADGDIQLKGGMQGGDKGMIECSADVWGKFFERTTLRVKGELHANSLLNCNVYVLKNIYVTGKRGIIVGGDTVCIGNIEATVLGNMAEVKTTLSAGMSDVMVHEIETLEKRIAEIKENLSKLRQVLVQIHSTGNIEKEQKLQDMHKQITSSIAKLETQLEETTASLNYNLAAVSEYSSPSIIVRKYLYRGVNIVLNGQHCTVKDTYTNVKIKEVDGKVSIINL